jgi:hypothetical protein
MIVMPAGLCYYRCFSAAAACEFIAINGFRDVLGDNVCKPLYVEAVPPVRRLLPDNEERVFRGRRFLSLIKTQSRRYTYNAPILEFGAAALGLTRVATGLGLDLLKVAEHDILETIEPAAAFALACESNPPLASLLNTIVAPVVDLPVAVGLIGTLCIDPHGPLFDIDLLFSGSATDLGHVHRWVTAGWAGRGPRLRKKWGNNAFVMDAFFTAHPVIYSKLRHLELDPGVERELSVRLAISAPLTPTFLNIQTYAARDVSTGLDVVLVVRDTLGRDLLKPGESVPLSARRATVGHQPAYLVTDVERQMPECDAHGDRS